ncbi:3404_t:CDS:2, partial [Racocetra persica]
QLKALANNVNDESSTTSEEKKNPHQLKHNLSTNIFESLYKLSEIQHVKNQSQFECSVDILNIFDNDFPIDNEKVPYSNYQNNIAAREFIKSIGHVIEQEHNRIPAIITKFAHATIKLLEKRFPNRTQINVFHIFNPMALLANNLNLQKYSKDEIEILSNFYGQDKFISEVLFPAKLNPENLKYE